MEQNYVSQHDSWVFAARAFTPSSRKMLLHPLRLAWSRSAPPRSSAACRCRPRPTNGGIQGRVTDKAGAVVPKAEVTATNTDTGVQTTVQSNGTGDYSIQPLQPGNYNVEVVAKGFQRLLQENVTSTRRRSSATTRSSPPAARTPPSPSPTRRPSSTPPTRRSAAPLRMNSTRSLPLSMNGGPRDPTAFQYLMPGVQENPANNSGTATSKRQLGNLRRHRPDQPQRELHRRRARDHI